MNDPKVGSSDVIARELRFAVHIPANRERPDLHFLKEEVHFQDGSSVPHIRFIANFKRPFWLAQPQYRAYKQKKEVEQLDRLMRYDCTQSEMQYKVADALGMSSHLQMKELSNSPYLYGSTINSTAILKHLSQKKNTTKITPYSVLMADIETDMVYGTEEPIIFTAVFNKELFIAVTKDYVKGFADPEGLFRSGCRQYITEFCDLTPYTIHYVEADNTVDLIKKSFAWIHERKPDFVSFWNMDFDIPKILDTLERYSVDPGSVLCDPMVPAHARICKYRQGLKKKRKANGQEVPIDVADQWHSLTLTASFYVIDSMCVYRLLRIASQKERSYSLDAILDKELGARKLRFDGAKGYVKDRWHTVMQSQFKIEYMVYALFDSLGMELLDLKIQDLRAKIPVMAGITDFARCNSKPKLIADDLHYYAILNHGKVLNSVGTTPEPEDKKKKPDVAEYVDPDVAASESDGEDEEDERQILDLLGWILALPAHLVTGGLRLLEESENIRTMLRAFVYDSDCVSAYPTATSILNVSKSTTKREIITIHEVDETLFRLQNINLSSGYVNALEYGNKMFGLPTMFDLVDAVSDGVSPKR